MHPREAARSVHSAPVHSGIGAQYLSLSAWRSTDCRSGQLCQHGRSKHRRRRRGVHSTTGTHADSMSKILSSRAQCEAISVFLIKHQLALVSVYKKWESAPAPLLSIAHISRALHKDSASVDNRRWAWRVGT